MSRNPSVDQNPLDRASFYIEELKYGPAAGDVERVTVDEFAGQLEVLLRDAGVTSMTGAQLADAAQYYGRSLARSFATNPVLAGSCFIDGLMHGIALAGGLQGELRDPRERAG
jgi:hypothetical protein